MLRSALLAIACLLAFMVPAEAKSPSDQWLSPSKHSAMVAVRFDQRRNSSTITHGLADPKTGRKVSADDPVRIASVSKLITSLAVMRLVERGMLSLDADISRWLGQEIRNPAFPDQPLTLRQLLSHQSSLTDNADYIIPLGQSIADRLADPGAWDAKHAPGGYFRYSNLNFPLIASIIENATGERFDQAMARLVFKPLRLDACFNWSTCSEAKIAKAVTLLGADGAVRRDDLNGVRPACLVVAASDGSCDLSRYPLGSNGALFSPQGGVRISMNDLARIGRLLIKRGRGFLKSQTFAQMTAAQWQFDGQNGDSENGFWCAYGLGVQILASGHSKCRDDPFGDKASRIGHPGEAYGLRSGLWIDPKTRTGIAFFVTAVPDNEPNGRSAFTLAEEMIVQNRRE